MLESQISYETTLDHMMKLLSFSPSVVITDGHPDYPSSVLGKEMAIGMGVQQVKIQHHEAHSYAVLAENDLLNEDRVLSIIWDGTGYGDDGQVWGGEFFEYADYKHRRVGQWAYYPHILGDKMSLEPRISAFCLARNIEGAEPLLTDKFEVNAFNNYDKLLKKGYMQSSSVGRIFDGVSSLLDITDYNTYEGEAAMYLEALAITYLDKNMDFNDTYEISVSEMGVLKTTDLITGIVKDKLDGYDNGYIAAKFHLSLAHVILAFLHEFNYQKVVFSGGVFQNNLLVDLIYKTLSDKYSVYFHKDLSPNDECIPFGQLIAWQVLSK
jgi:hydrogenase maturation protein HypF